MMASLSDLEQTPPTLAEWRALRDARIRACFDMGMMLTDAARVTGISRDNIAAWSMRNDVFWPAYVRPLRGVDVQDMPPMPPLVAADLCPSACRQLWASVLVDQWNAIFGGHFGDGADQRKRDAMSWFASRDFACVCTLAGVDPAYVSLRYRRALNRASGVGEDAADPQHQRYRRRVANCQAVAS